MQETVLLIDDDTTMHHLFQMTLRDTGYSLEIADSGLEGLRKAYINQPHIILLDIMMPGLSGWDTCKRLREMCDVPIIMVTALGQQKDVITGLDLGADDYIIKPFKKQEIIARIQALVRRASRHKSYNEPGHVISYEHLTIDLDKREVNSDGQRVDLSPKEYRLLSTLAQNKGKVLSRDYLLSKVWGPQYINQKQYLHIYINYLRSKLDKDSSQPSLISNVRGIGYRFG